MADGVRVQVPVRVRLEVVEELDAIAAREDTSRSVVLRRLLGVGLAAYRREQQVLPRVASSSSEPVLTVQAGVVSYEPVPLVTHVNSALRAIADGKGLGGKMRPSTPAPTPLDEWDSA